MEISEDGKNVFRTELICDGWDKHGPEGLTF